jgi:hypothetical protein
MIKIADMISQEARDKITQKFKIDAKKIPRKRIASLLVIPINLTILKKK